MALEARNKIIPVAAPLLYILIAHQFGKFWQKKVMGCIDISVWPLSHVFYQCNAPGPWQRSSLNTGK
jgi:hypothetical protein